MARSETERLEELDQKVKQLQAKKQRLQAQINHKKRKERTRRLIQIGAIFEKYFELEGVEEAEKVAFSYADNVKKNREKWEAVTLPKEEKVE